MPVSPAAAEFRARRRPVGFIGRVAGPLPQRAWLEGSKLTVERRRGASQCDLATAPQVRYHPCKRGPCWFCTPTRNTRQRTCPAAEPGRIASKIVRRLNALAMDEDRRNKPIDWSFRTGPQDYRRPATGSPRRPGSGLVHPERALEPSGLGFVVAIISPFSCTDSSLHNCLGASHPAFRIRRSSRRVPPGRRPKRAGSAVPVC